MQVEIFDVGHGQCACVTTPNGRRILVDCGHRTDPHWWPSVHFAGRSADLLVVTNLDEDHISDFHDLQRHAPPGLIVTNPTVSATQLIAMKHAGMGAGTRAYYQWLSSPASGTWAPLPDFGGVVIERFSNSYGAPFVDSNNLSLVTVVSYAGFTILFPGDLERAGWSRLLADQPRLRQWLPQVNVFVTSHHGRENGCSDELFNGWKPQLFVISDDVMQHDTQETGNWYRNRAHGLDFQRPRTSPGLMGILQSGTERRYVLTTRNDKSMQFNVQANGDWTCRTGIDHTRS